MQLSQSRAHRGDGERGGTMPRNLNVLQTACPVAYTFSTLLLSTVATLHNRFGSPVQARED